MTPATLLGPRRIKCRQSSSALRSLYRFYLLGSVNLLSAAAANFGTTLVSDATGYLNEREIGLLGRVNRKLRDRLSDATTAARSPAMGLGQLQSQKSGPYAFELGSPLLGWAERGQDSPSSSALGSSQNSGLGQAVSSTKPPARVTSGGKEEKGQELQPDTRLNSSLTGRKRLVSFFSSAGDRERVGCFAPFCGKKPILPASVDSLEDATVPSTEEHASSSTSPAVSKVGAFPCGSPLNRMEERQCILKSATHLPIVDALHELQTLRHYLLHQKDSRQKDLKGMFRSSSLLHYRASSRTSSGSSSSSPRTAPPVHQDLTALDSASSAMGDMKSYLYCDDVALHDQTPWREFLSFLDIEDYVLRGGNLTPPAPQPMRRAQPSVDPVASAAAREQEIERQLRRSVLWLDLTSSQKAVGATCREEDEGSRLCDGGLDVDAEQGDPGWDAFQGFLRAMLVDETIRSVRRADPATDGHIFPASILSVAEDGGGQRRGREDYRGEPRFADFVVEHQGERDDAVLVQQEQQRTDDHSPEVLIKTSPPKALQRTDHHSPDEALIKTSAPEAPVLPNCLRRPMPPLKLVVSLDTGASFGLFFEFVESLQIFRAVFLGIPVADHDLDDPEESCRRTNRKNELLRRLRRAIKHPEELDRQMACNFAALCDPVGLLGEVVRRG
ncbi:unnamed protein product [Amoebophrya sp. A25]|nr:unnamed protein product [Amoebophrya sp. A25]|eukprot:GSA25T00008115001.1